MSSCPVSAARPLEIGVFVERLDFRLALGVANFIFVVVESGVGLSFVCDTCLATPQIRINKVANRSNNSNADDEVGEGHEL